MCPRYASNAVPPTAIQVLSLHPRSTLQVFPKNEGSKKLLRTVLAESFMFASLSKGDLERMVDAFQERRVPADEVVIKQG